MIVDGFHIDEGEVLDAHYDEGTVFTVDDLIHHILDQAAASHSLLEQMFEFISENGWWYTLRWDGRAMMVLAHPEWVMNDLYPCGRLAFLGDTVLEAVHAAQQFVASQPKLSREVVDANISL